MEATQINRGTLRKALTQREIIAHYQPEFRIDTGEISAVEALARWQLPSGHLFTAAHFIPLAEETGLIGELSRHVMEEACGRVADWLVEAEGLGSEFRVWVNVAADDLISGAVRDHLAELLSKTQTDPSRIGIEITERALLDNVDRSVALLQEIRDMGVRLAVDDFGTGYASLTYLRRFPVDIVKIDQSFISGLGVRSNDDAIVRAVVGLAHSLGLEVLAEGVQTHRQLAELRALRCDYAQGYLLSRPLPPGEICSMLQIEQVIRITQLTDPAHASFAAGNQGLRQIATQVGADDLFVLHDVSDGQMLNIAGAGRGASWAGNVHVNPNSEPFLHQALELREVLRTNTSLRRIFGPYWAKEAALVAVGRNVVVFGGGSISSTDDQLVLSAAADAAWCANVVPAEKQLADERELSGVALSVARLRPTNRAEGAVAIAGEAAKALSCEFASVILENEPEIMYLAPDSWRPLASEEHLLKTLHGLGDVVSEGPFFENDVESSPHAQFPLSIDEGVLALCVVPLGNKEDQIGHLVCGHTVAGPRGFTNLCQRVAKVIAEQAVTVLDSV